MSFSDRHRRQDTFVELPGPTSTRPRSLLQRISSGLLSLTQGVYLRIATPKHNHRYQAASAPNCALVYPGSWQEPTPGIDIPILSNTDAYCDPSRYPSAPSNGKPRCVVCGRRWPAGLPTENPVVSRSCSHCRARSAWSRSTLRRRPLRDEGWSIAVDQSNMSAAEDISSSSQEAPQILAGDIVVERMGNSARRGHRPLAPSHTEAPPPTGKTYISCRHPVPRTRSKVGESLDVRHESPKLHHVHGLPKTDEYPYVHKHEVHQHLAALRAGSPSPLTNNSTSLDAGDATTVSSCTVHYGSVSSATVSHQQRRTSQRQSVTLVVQAVEDSGEALVATAQHAHVVTLDVALGATELYFRRSPEPRDGHSPQLDPVPQSLESAATFGTTDTGSTQRVGGHRLELKGGTPCASGRLRGGAGERVRDASSCGFKLKRWLLSGRLDKVDTRASSSEDDLPPSRILKAAGLTLGRQRACGKILMPTYISSASYIGTTKKGKA